MHEESTCLLAVGLVRVVPVLLSGLDSLSIGCCLPVGQPFHGGSIFDKHCVECAQMGPLVFEYCRRQPQHRGLGCLHGSMGGAGCVTGFAGPCAFFIAHLVVCTRAAQPPEKAVNPTKPAENPAIPLEKSVLINNFYGFIHEMTGTPCQR